MREPLTPAAPSKTIKVANQRVRDLGISQVRPDLGPVPNEVVIFDSGIYRGSYRAVRYPVQLLDNPIKFGLQLVEVLIARRFLIKRFQIGADIAGFLFPVGQLVFGPTIPCLTLFASEV